VLTVERDDFLPARHSSRRCQTHATGISGHHARENPETSTHARRHPDQTRRTTRLGRARRGNRRRRQSRTRHPVTPPDSQRRQKRTRSGLFVAAVFALSRRTRNCACSFSRRPHLTSPPLQRPQTMPGGIAAHNFPSPRSRHTPSANIVVAISGSPRSLCRICADNASPPQAPRSAQAAGQTRTRSHQTPSRARPTTTPVRPYLSSPSNSPANAP
jgi:hypothetical protein